MARKSLLFIFCFALISNWVFAQDSTKVDWEDFYPLHIGDFWKYSGWQDHADILYTRRVVGIDSMPNGKQYAKILKIDYIFGNQGHIYERVDSLGDVYEYYKNINEENLLYKLNVCLGDTWPALSSGYWKVIEKYEEVIGEDTITCISIAYYPFWVESAYFYKLLKEGLGLTHYRSEEGDMYCNLTGACINGIVFGDTTITTIRQMPEEFLPDNIILHQNYPNPFNQSTKIVFEIPQGGEITLTIYNMRGEMVKQPINQHQRAGRHEIYWDGNNENGSNVASGIYFYQLKIGNHYLTKKLLLLR